MPKLTTYRLDKGIFPVAEKLLNRHLHTLRENIRQEQAGHAKVTEDVKQIRLQTAEQVENELLLIASLRSGDIKLTVLWQDANLSGPANAPDTEGKTDG